MGFKVEIDGIQNLYKAFEAKRKEIAEIIKKDVDEGADKIIATAKEKAPKDKHNLENAIDKNEVWDKNNKISVSVGIQINDVFKKADGWYARMQEKGTSKMKAHPYLRPALNKHKKEIHGQIENDIKRVL
jgi:HK97 gp10 family phage protein